MPVSKWLIIVGLILVAAGLLWPVMSKLGLGRLPGDIVGAARRIQSLLSPDDLPRHIGGRQHRHMDLPALS